MVYFVFIVYLKVSMHEAAEYVVSVLKSTF